MKISRLTTLREIWKEKILTEAENTRLLDNVLLRAAEEKAWVTFQPAFLLGWTAYPNSSSVFFLCFQLRQGVPRYPPIHPFFLCLSFPNSSPFSFSYSQPLFCSQPSRKAPADEPTLKCVFLKECVSVCTVVSDSCDPINHSPPDSSVHEIFQARILEWVAISSSRGSFWIRDQTCISSVFWEIHSKEKRKFGVCEEVGGEWRIGLMKGGAQ